MTPLPDPPIAGPAGSSSRGPASPYAFRQEEPPEGATVVAIVGSRGFPDLLKVRAFVRMLPAGTWVVSGGARGVDWTAEDEAQRCGLGRIVVRPDWNRHGRRAGLLRNDRIVGYAHRVVAFWDGQSRGTAYTIDAARRKGVPVWVLGPDSDINSAKDGV